MGKLRFGVAFAVIDRKRIGGAEAFPGGGRKRRRGVAGVATAINYPVQGTPGSLTSL